MQESLDYIKTAVIIKQLFQNGITDFRKHYIIADQEQFRKNKEKLFLKEYTPVKGDRIYIYPDSTIPRFKIKQFCENYNVAVVKFVDKANISIISEKGLNCFFDLKHHYAINKEEVLKILTSKIHLFKNGSDLIKEIESCTYPKVYFHYHTGTEFERRTSIKLSKSYEHFYNFHTGDDYLKFQKIITADNVYNQNEILRRLNSGAVMDEKQYEGARQLLNSKDMENTKLAIEIMANCDFEKSSVYLLLLIRDFGHKIFDCPNRTHVNFKSLLKFFNITNLRGVHLDDIMSTLIDLKLLNQANLNRLEPELIEDMKSYVSDYLIPEKIAYSEKVIKALEENILDKNADTEIVFEEPEIINPHL